MLRMAMVLVATAVFGPDAEAAVRVYRPTDPSQVVLRLGNSSSELLLAQLRTASRDAPGDLDALIRYVDALIEAGARSGNERYYGYAEQTLSEVTDKAPATVTLRRAELLQHRHEFRDAERLLGEVLRANGRDRDARLMRAQVRLHLHEPQRALEDCAALTPFADMLTSATCIAQARAALGDLQRAYALIVKTLQSQGGDASTRSWSAGVAAELAVRLGDSHAAGRWYREAFERDADSHYARLTYADWLLSAGHFDEALQVSRRGSSLADRARSVLAARDPQSFESHRLQLAWQEADARGERAHLRDRARFELMLLHDAATAHATAVASFRERNEADDALLLAATAAATHDRESVRAIDAWRRQYRYEDVRLDHLLGAVQ